MFFADLHVHSKYSRATSGEADLENLARWAMKKGLTLVATGDFTHPAWLAELTAKLEPAEPGLFQLKRPILAEVEARVPETRRAPTRFILSVEISTIYKKGGKVRKVHHVILVPDLAAAARLRKALAKIGNLASDGRPILGLDSRDLLEIALESGEGSFLIPAHVWTPWFSALGSKSGFDAIEECYGDLADKVFALETGLSSDPPMNHRLSGLDRYRLVSCSDAHSPSRLGREACRFETALDFFALRRALETGVGYGGTIEMFPEEGKYHLDGHRKCGRRLTPEETRRHGGLCPECGKPVTVGVLSRVEELADRPEGTRLAGAAGFRSFIPLAEVLGEVLGAGPATKTVARAYERLIERVGPELYLLGEAPLEELGRHGSAALSEAARRMRAGEVVREAGYDGEYGVIRLFRDGELMTRSGATLMFELPEAQREPRADVGPGREARSDAVGGRDEREGGDGRPRVARPPAPRRSPTPRPGPARAGVLAGLDDEQAAAAASVDRPLLIVAGPGAGKTRTLTHRIAHLVRERGVRPERCLAITFTRRAASELGERLAALLGPEAKSVTATTFHGLGLSILQEHGASLGLPRRVRVASSSESGELLAAALVELGGGKKGRVSARRLSQARSAVSRLKSGDADAARDPELKGLLAAYDRGLRARGLVDFDDLISLPVELLESDPAVLGFYRERFTHVAIDEYQDLDGPQYRLVRALCPEGSPVLAIGDPDQAIYAFRGADVSFFLRFQQDYPSARVMSLFRDYRSGPGIVDGACQMIAPSSLLPGRRLEAVAEGWAPITVHQAATERAEAEFVIHTIERAIGGSSFFALDSGRAEGGWSGDYSFSDFAVLYRTSAQAEALAEAFQNSGAPFQRREHGRLRDAPEVDALCRVLRGLEPGLFTSGLVRKAAEISGAGAGTVDLLLDLAEGFEDDLEGFLAEVALGAETDAWDPRGDRVSLMTLHAAKGLEFRVAFIVGVEDGLLPLRFGGKMVDRAEERRLLFVGMTRARERLVISHASQRLVRGRVRRMKPSPFLADIEEALLERSKTPAPAQPKPPRAEQLRLF